MRILPTLLAAAAALTLAGPAAAHEAPPTVPDTIRVDGQTMFLKLHAIGVQIYACNGTVWQFVAPRADLYNDAGKLKMTHFAGPTWKYKDGSEVAGTVTGIAPVSPTTAIPWLRLAAKSTTAGPFGGDRLLKTTHIQRIATHGGLVPDAATCNASTANTTAEVPYTA